MTVCKLRTDKSLGMNIVGRTYHEIHEAKGVTMCDILGLIFRAGREKVKKACKNRGHFLIGALLFIRFILRF